MLDLNAYLKVRESLLNFLREDIGTGDMTSNSIVQSDTHAFAEIICKAEKPSVVCGLGEASIIFEICKCKSKAIVKDGSLIKKGSKVMEIVGNALSIMKAERTALNLIMRMSGIATETKKFTALLNHRSSSVRIASTRKTAPGLRLFDKKAVKMGGGETHRMQLDDMVLIKDNHISVVGSVEKAIENARKKIGKSIKVECEATNVGDAIAAVNAGADYVMLDNFSPRAVARTIDELSRRGIRNKAEIEVSGGIRLQNIMSYAKSKPDIISVGYLTHSPKAVDFSLEVMETKI
ncbi:MAG TPA: carboxylating nicotinate-nucleotide diphosphorylase [Nitrososphaeraceae archaeon]|nr:carboxylating nicotinate-nucleotide diphosphorylase [Nitrososphaeraceae archaeon]